MIGTLPGAVSASAGQRAQRLRHLLGRVGVMLLLLSGAALMLLPLAWMLSASLKVNAEVFMTPPRWIPATIQWQNYPNALTRIDYWRYFSNTLIITILSVVGEVVSASLVAFGFARLRARGKDTLFILLLSTLMLPAIVTLVPRYLLFRSFGWVNTYLPLIVPSWLGNPFYIFMLRQFFSSIPLELDDAAKIDGCSLFGIYWRIMLPLCKPALSAVAIFSFFAQWNDFINPLVFLTRPETYTIPLGLQFFISTFGQTDFNLLMAASLVSLIPPVLVFFLFQRTFVQGIALTGLKG